MSIEHRNLSDASSDAAAVDVFTSEGGRPLSGEAEREMQELGVEVDGPDYCYKGYRYERLTDALAYARLRRLMPGREDDSPARRPRPLTAPSEDDRALMASLGIEFDGRAFRFADYRYDRLEDAVSSARRSRVAP
jgi:hypothetical protein